MGLKYSAKTQLAVKKYGYKTCVEAFRMNELDGEGARTVGIYLGLKTGQADAAINAGREIAEAAALRVRYFTAEAGGEETKIDGLTVLCWLQGTENGCWSDPIARRKIDLAAAHLSRLCAHKVLSFRILEADHATI